jgi:hypothetical protein
MADKVIDVEIRTNTTGIKSLRQELRETTIALQQATDPKYIEELQQKAGQLKDRMMDVNAEINAMASGSKFERVASSLGLVGESLRNMDFAEASERAMLFAKTAKAITFKDAIGSVKDLGKTFMTVGKAILTNPLFLIAGIIVLIGVAIVKLLDKMGILKKIFEAIGAVVDWLIQGLKDFLDWIGLTNFAVEDAAQAQADAAKKTAEAMEAKSAAVVQGYDQEIRMAELDGKNTEDVTMKKLWWLREVQKAKAQQLIDELRIAKITGDLDEAELKTLEQKMFAEIALVRKATDDITYQRKLNAKNKEKETEDDAKKDAENAKKASETRKKNQEKINQEIQKAVQFNKDAQKENELNLLSAQDREIKISNDKYQAQIDQAIKYKQDYSQIVIAQKNAENEINLKYETEKVTKAEEAQALIDQINKDFLNSRLSDIDQEKLAVSNKYAKAIEDATKNGLDTTVLKANQKAEEDAIDLAYDEKKKANMIELASWMNTFNTDERAKYIADLDAKQLEDEAKLKEAKDNKLLTEQEYQDALKAIQIKTIDDVAEYDKKKAKDSLNSKLENVQKYVDASTGLMTALGDLAVATAKKDVKSQEAAARKKFQIDKAAALLSAAMATAVGIAKATPNPALMALAGLTGAAQIAVIASKQFNSGAGSQAPPSLPSANVSEPQANATPIFNMFGTGGTANNQNASGNNTNGQNITVTAVVSETDMTYTQERVNSMKLSASL